MQCVSKTTVKNIKCFCCRIHHISQLVLIVVAVALSHSLCCETAGASALRVLPVCVLGGSMDPQMKGHFWGIS